MAGEDLAADQQWSGPLLGAPPSSSHGKHLSRGTERQIHQDFTTVSNSRAGRQACAGRRALRNEYDFAIIVKSESNL